MAVPVCARRYKRHRLEKEDEAGHLGRLEREEAVRLPHHSPGENQVHEWRVDEHRVVGTSAMITYA
jgi:hypothetical protein